MVLSHPPQQQHERLCGVYKRSGGKQTYWVAQTLKYDGKYVRKFFNVAPLGEEQALALASENRFPTTSAVTSVGSVCIRN